MDARQSSDLGEWAMRYGDLNFENLKKIQTLTENLRLRDGLQTPLRATHDRLHTPLHSLVFQAPILGVVTIALAMFCFWPTSDGEMRAAKGGWIFRRSVLACLSRSLSLARRPMLSIFIGISDPSLKINKIQAFARPKDRSET